MGTHLCLWPKPSEPRDHSSCSRSISEERTSPHRQGGLYLWVTGMPWGGGKGRNWINTMTVQERQKNVISSKTDKANGFDLTHNSCYANPTYKTAKPGKLKTLTDGLWPPEVLWLRRHSSLLHSCPLAHWVFSFRILFVSQLLVSCSGMGREGFWKSGWVQIIDGLVEKLCLFQRTMGAINFFDWAA